GAPRPADRHPCRERLSPSGDVARLAYLLRGGLCQPGAGFPVAGREPDLRGRVREVSQAQGGADRVRRDLGAGIPVALLEVLARSAQRGALGRPAAGGDLPRSLPHDHPAARRAGFCRRDRARDRPPALRRGAALFERLSALAVRRRRGPAAGLVGWIAPQDHGGQSAGDVSDFVGWAKRSVPTIGWARRFAPLPTPTGHGASHLHHHVFVLDADREGLRRVWSLHQLRAGLYGDGEIAHPHAARIAPRLAGADVVFPLVPRAAQNLAVTRGAVLARPG